MSHLALSLLILFASAFAHGILEIKMSVGSTVILPSGADTSMPLNRIGWYIFENKTLIALFSSTTTSLGLYPPLKGRLNLNTMTGNLEIRNLALEDSRTYTVEIINVNNDQRTYEVTLSVFGRLPKPTLEIYSTRADGLCLLSLMCSVSNRSEVKFNWSPDPLPPGCSWDLQHNSTALMAPEATSERSAWCSPDQTVTIHCTANDSVSSTSSTKSVKCSAAEKSKDVSGWIFFGIFYFLCFST